MDLALNLPQGKNDEKNSEADSLWSLFSETEDPLSVRLRLARVSTLPGFKDIEEDGVTTTRIPFTGDSITINPNSDEEYELIIDIDGATVNWGYTTFEIESASMDPALPLLNKQICVTSIILNGKHQLNFKECDSLKMTNDLYNDIVNIELWNAWHLPHQTRLLGLNTAFAKPTMDNYFTFPMAVRRIALRFLVHDIVDSV
ncbi:MAG: hypothetical protein LBC96_06775 [Lachnospiraceae bacterium]|jgi:hypothetical protein|nr:hypothetical protein [Lachnospiraceae bacterium]